MLAQSNRSLNVAVIASALAWLLLLARTFLDFEFVYQEFNLTTAMTSLTIVLMTALFGAYFWSLHHALNGKRGGLIAIFILTLLLPVIGGIFTLTSLCPSPCPTANGLMEIFNWAHLLIGVLATVFIAQQLRTGVSS